MSDLSSSGKERLQTGWRPYALALVACGGVSLLNSWLQPLVGYEAVALVYLLSVVLLALFVSRGAILFGAALTALAWNFLFLPPRYSLHVGSFYNKMMLAMYFVVALTIGQLMAQLRAERLAQQEREERSTALYLLIRALADATDRGDIISRAVQQVRKAFRTDVALLLPERGKNSPLIPAESGSWQMKEADQKAAIWAFENNTPVGLGTQPWPEAEGLHMPLEAGSQPAGVLGLRWTRTRNLTLHQRDLLESFARQIALVLDRHRLREAEVGSRLVQESERLGRTLLNSVSHELRTPLAAITSAASSLGRSGPLNPPQQNLVKEIESAAARLNRVVQSLLSAARLQSGQLRPQLDWCDLSELARTTLHNLGDLLSGRCVETHVPSRLPLVKADFVLMEQVLGNLLVNAATHTPPGTPIEIRVRTEGDQNVILEVADRGPGLPPKELGRVFDLFHRAPAAKPGGAGLGLAIVKGFVEAQGGYAKACNRPGGGAMFSISLPAAPRPQLQEEPHESIV